MTPRFESQGNVFPLEVFKEEYDVGWFVIRKKILVITVWKWM